MESSRPKAICFDFDFTLADSTLAASTCINFALGQLGLEQYPVDAIRRTVGYPLRIAFKRLTKISDDATIQRFHEIYLAYADQVMVGLTPLYTDAIPLLQWLAENDIPAVIVSTKFRYRIESILALRSARQWFKFIIGGEDVTSHKPSPEGLLIAHSRLQIPREEMLYVGDHLVDAQAAHAAQIPFAAVLTGTTTAADFREWETRICAENLAALQRWLAT